MSERDVLGPMMRLKANQSMHLKMLQALASSVSLPDELARMADAGIVEVAGCYFLKAYYRPHYTATPEQLVDRTGLECFVNKLHIDAFAETSWLPIAVNFAFRILERLNSEHPQAAFCFIVSLNDASDPDCFPSCTARFHCIRPGETWVAEDLNGYKLEAVLTITSTR